MVGVTFSSSTDYSYEGDRSLKIETTDSSWRAAFTNQDYVEPIDRTGTYTIKSRIRGNTGLNFRLTAIKRIPGEDVEDIQRIVIMEQMIFNYVK